MPDYDYKCDSCNEITTINKSMTDDCVPECLKCGSKKVNRVWQKVQFKGCGCNSSGEGCTSCSGCSCSS